MTTHIVETTFEGDYAHWECSCGRAGSCREDRADIASDKHIDYGAGDRRTDRTILREWR